MEELFEELRPRAFAIAYRMLGSVSEAEDVVQDAFLRLHRAVEAGERIESPAAYVATMVARLCIDELRSARARRERYVGEWLPEPLLMSEEDDPAHHAEVADSLSLAFLVLLESLSPEQRAVFLLQLAVRAPRHIDERRPRFEASRDQRDRLASRFFEAVEDGDLAALETLLADDVVLHGDGGGKAPAIARPLRGRVRVARTLLAWARAAERFGGASVRRVWVNRQPGAVTLDPDGELIGVLALDIADGRVQAVNSVVNPDKLRHLGPVADVAALLRRPAAAPPHPAAPSQPPHHADLRVNRLRAE